MKSILIGLLALFSLNLNAQAMKSPYEIIVQLFVATDLQNWETVEEIFSSEVLLDYSSMNGNAATTLSPNQITAAWKKILPGFEHTHHQIGNLIANKNGNRASVFCYGTATHFLTNDQGNVWTVVGSYDFDLIKSDGAWKISSMKFNYKYQDGNTSLPEEAIKNTQQ